MNNQSEQETATTEIRNPELVNTMAAVAANDTPENRQHLYAALLESTLILPVAESLTDADTPQRLTLDADASLQLVAFDNDEGEIVFIAFTDEESVLAWQPEGAPYIAMSAPDLFALAERTGVGEVLLNPAGPVRGNFLGTEIAVLAQGEIPQRGGEEVEHDTLPVGTTVLIGPPRETPPEAWYRALERAIRRQPLIQEAYLFQLHVPAEGEHLAVGIVFEPGFKPEIQDDIMRQLISRVKVPLPENIAIDYVVLDRSDFLQIVRDTVPPLYERYE